MRFFFYLRACAGFIAFLLLALLWLLPAPGRVRRTLARLAFCSLCAGFGLRIRGHGTPCAGGVLYVANHQSWTDIAVLAILTDAGFVAKHEVRGWPLIGHLAARYGCLFIERERRGRAHAQAKALTARLTASHDGGLILFPEGTTGDGQEVLPFRSSLFVLADEEGRRIDRQVQPIAIRYCRHDGSPFSPDAQRRIAWVGDEALLPHALGLAASGGALVEVWFEPPVTGTDRKSLAAAARMAIVERLGNKASITPQR